MRKLLPFLLIIIIVLVGCTRPKPRPPTPTPPPPEAVAQQEVQPTPTETPGAPETPQLSQTPVSTTPTPEAPPEEQVTPVAPAPSEAQPQPSTEEGYIFYEVRWGDTLESIAYRFGTTVEALVQLNGLVDKDVIYVGQRLKVPGRARQPAPAQAAEYVVQPGDTLTGIAARFNTTVEAIMAANRIINPNFIYVGQKLVIPGGVQTAVPTTQPRIHIVQWGETLTSIAFRYGTTVEAIVRANNLPNPNFIYAGQRLVIP